MSKQSWLFWIVLSWRGNGLHLPAGAGQRSADVHRQRPLNYFHLWFISNVRNIIIIIVMIVVVVT